MNKIKLYSKALLHPVLASQYLWYVARRGFSHMLAWVGYYRYPYKIIFLAGMAMGGSTWMKKLLAGIPGYYVRDMPMPDEVRNNCNIIDSAFDKTPKTGYTVYKTHLEPTESNYTCIRKHYVEKIIVMHRDLRDVAVSRYHRLCVDPKDPHSPDYIDYNVLGKEEGISHSIKIIAQAYTTWINGWLEMSMREPERFHFVKFEDLKKDTKNEFKKILDFYNINLKDTTIDLIIEKAKGKSTLKKNLKKAELLPFGVSSNFRSGKVGGWKEEMTDEQKKRCKELFGDLLITLGYETNSGW